MANPNREELLGPVYSILEARTKHHAPIVQLKGKLNFLLKQLNTRPEETSNVDANKEALLGTTITIKARLICTFYLF